MLPHKSDADAWLLLSHSGLTKLACPTTSATYLVHTPQGFGKQHISRRHVREHIGVCILIRIQALLAKLVLAGSLPSIISPAQWPRYNFSKHKDCRAIWSSVLRTASVCSAKLCNQQAPSATYAHDVDDLYLHIQVATICFNWTLFLVKYHNILEWWLLEILVRIIKHSSVTVNQ